MPETSEHASAAAIEPTRLDASQDSHLESLYRAAIGPMQADYYLPILTRFEAYGRPGPRWNWAACLVTLNWMVLRGLWLPALAYLAGVAGTALALAAGLALAEPPPAESVQWGLWSALATLALLIPGFFGNAWLYRVYRRRIDTALARTANLQQASALLARHSSSPPRLTAIVMANVLLAVGLAFAFWPASWRVDMGPDAGGGVATTPTPSATPSAPQAEPSQVAAPSADAAAAPAKPTPAASAPDMAQPASATATPPPPLATGPAPASTVDTSATTASPAASAAANPAASAASDAASAAAGVPATEPVLESPSMASTPPPAPPPAVAEAASQPLGPLAQAAAQRQAAIAAHARKAHLPATAASKAAAAESAPAPAAAATAAPEGTYLINIGLFAQADNAQRAHARLKLAGLPAISELLPTRNGPRTRVRVGPFATRAQADAAAERIRALQLDAVVIRQ